ncbi:hypothetical protein BN946_scf184569.g42 [Trametes cinnabarina]|uniref:Cytochrome P450 n=1 Tax=Pycnoporus cinnabarinus TaxID=5643 RepID=A0A060SDZ8_PYCCI|nr:hypothetical protein BN946_scf184569.g42 [Trametes cinnabarina]
MMFEDNRTLVLLLLLAALFLLRRYLDFSRAAASVGNLRGFRTLFSDRFIWFPYRLKGISPGLQSEQNLYRKYKDFEDAGGWDIIAGWSNRIPSWTLFSRDPKILSTFGLQYQLLFITPVGSVPHIYLLPWTLHTHVLGDRQEVLGARARFPKPMGPYKVLLAFGPNLVASEGDEWKRQRKLVAPAFSEKNNRLVWDETIRILYDLFDNVWGDRDTILIDNITDITVPITLLVIGVAGFGRRITWNEDAVAPPGHKMTFKVPYAPLSPDALNVVSRNLFYQVLFPRWLLRIGTPGMRRFHTAMRELGAYMQEMIDARRNGGDSVVKGERHDLFSSLLDANEGLAGEGEKLTDVGLMGASALNYGPLNVRQGLAYPLGPSSAPPYPTHRAELTFLLFPHGVGYETSAHTLAYAFILLALYPDEQEKLYEAIKTTLHDGRTPVSRALLESVCPSLVGWGTRSSRRSLTRWRTSLFTHSLIRPCAHSLTHAAPDSVFNETLRLFPPVISIPKQSAEHTSFTTTNAAGATRMIPVPKGTFVTIHTPGLHSNPRYWDEPEAFRPERFLGGRYNRDAFLPFSGGPRGAIGRGFSETESIAVLTLVVSRYRVEVRDEPQFAGESFAQRKARLLKSKLSVTLLCVLRSLSARGGERSLTTWLTVHSPERAPLVFKRR